jgi:hypothetical protein
MEHHQGKLVDLYTGSLRDAREDLRKQREHFTLYGQLLLDELCDFGESIDFGEAARSISDPDFSGYLPVAA